jgi:hypothetical protein
MTATPRFTYRPRKVRRVAWVVAVVVVVVFTVLGTALTGPTDSGKSVFRTSDQVAMIILGVLAGAAILLFTRPRVSADERHIEIRNVIGGYDLPWVLVRELRFERGASWVTLELEDDDVVAVMAIQAADKEYAVAAARQLRALLDASRAATPPA